MKETVDKYGSKYLHPCVSLTGIEAQGYMYLCVCDSFLLILGLDIVVANSAMVPKQTGFTDLSVEDFQSVLNLNVISQVVVAKAALPHLEVTKGNIVFMSSIAGKT